MIYLEVSIFKKLMEIDPSKKNWIKEEIVKKEIFILQKLISRIN